MNKDYNFEEDNHIHTIGICSGYFQRFHEGHRKYISDCIEKFDYTVVIINNDNQQKNKYKGFEKIKSVKKIGLQIKSEFPQVEIFESIDEDESVNETLNILYKRFNFCDFKLYFCKDGDRNINNIAEKQTLKELGIKLIQFNNAKINSSSEIMKKGD